MSRLPLGERTDRVSDVLRSARSKGVRLWAHNGKLCYEAPQGALTSEELEKLRASKQQILALLESSNALSSSRLGRRSAKEIVPLAFSQLAHWREFRLGERPSIRVVASATRLDGTLDIGVLRESLDEVVRWHEALRTRVPTVNGNPIQVVGQSGADFDVGYMEHLPPSLHESEAVNCLERLLFEPVEVAAGPLFVTRLLRFGADRHVLLVAMEHMISDGISRDILLRDLFAAYAQISKGCRPMLPDVPIQFADYSLWQQKEQKQWIEKHGTYWRDRLSSTAVLRFPIHSELLPQANAGMGMAPFRLSSSQWRRLKDWCRANRTTPVMGALTAYVTLLLRWCEAREGVILYQTSGRFSSLVENTIGYFAFRLKLRVELHAQDTFLDLLHQVSEEYCTAHKHADHGWLETETAYAELGRNPAFNWLTLGTSGNRHENLGLVCTAIPYQPRRVDLHLDAEPRIVFLESASEVRGFVQFPAHRFGEKHIEQFVRNFLSFLDAMLCGEEVLLRNVKLVE